MRAIEKASGRQAGSAASGIREPEKRREALLLPYRTPLVARPLFQSSALSESLEQAIFGVTRNILFGIFVLD